MPAIITHHLFGEDALPSLPEGTIEGQEELLAYLLGNQGPDPLYFRFAGRPSIVRTCNMLADALHDSKVVEALMVARRAVTHLPENERRIGRAFALGFLGHYVLDSTSHPFVYAQQEALCSEGTGLEGHENEVHAIIESDIDSWMLWSLRGLTVSEAPTPANLAHTERVVHVAGALVAQMASEVFGTAIRVGDYGDALSDAELIYAIIDPAPSLRTKIVARIESKLLGSARLDSLAHHPVTTDECPSANLDHRRWRDPYSGKPSMDSFPDLYFLALERWPAFATALIEGDAEQLKHLSAGINYNGRPEL